MPGIADSPASQINPNSVTALSAQPDVNISSLGNIPSFDLFMNAFRNGQITADDIRKRSVLGSTGEEAQRAENVARKAGAEQTQIDIGEVRPRQREAAVQQLEGATAEQSLLNRINNPDTSVSFPAREEFAQRQLDAQSSAVYGTPQPDLFKSTAQKPEEFDSWVVRQANDFQGSDAARADFVNHLRERGAQGEEYKKYASAVKEAKIPIPKGTPEYNKALRQHVHEALTYEKLQQINFEILKTSGEARAKATAELPVVQAKAQAASAPELRKEYSSLPQVHDFEKVDAAHNKLLAATDPSQPSTPLRDQAAIFSWMKVLDPGSTVREGEYASVRNAAGVPDKIMNYYNRVVQGVLLNPEQRKELREAVDGQYNGQIQNLAPRIKQFVDQEQKAGLAPGTVVPLEHRALLESRPATPASAAPASAAPRLTPQEDASLPTYSSPKDIPSSVRVFKTPDGRKLFNPAYRP